MRVFKEMNPADVVSLLRLAAALAGSPCILYTQAKGVADIAVDAKYEYVYASYYLLLITSTPPYGNETVQYSQMLVFRSTVGGHAI